MDGSVLDVGSIGWDRKKILEMAEFGSHQFDRRAFCCTLCLLDGYSHASSYRSGGCDPGIFGNVMRGWSKTWPETVPFLK